MFEKKGDIYVFKYEELTLEDVYEFGRQFRLQCLDELDLIMTEIIFHV